MFLHSAMAIRSHSTIVASSLIETRMAGRDTGWEEVSSSHVKAIRHVGAPDNVLYVKYKNGSMYKYANVDAKVWTRISRAVSKGKFVWRVLRSAPGTYPATIIQSGD